MRIAAIIPAFNEQATIHDVAARALRQLSDVIVVDDGSTDATAAQLDDLAVRLIRNEVNLGKAASLRRAMDIALQEGFDAVITLDGDGQHNPEDIPRLLAQHEATADAVVIAARLRGQENAPRSRYWANRIADFFISWAAGQRIADSQSGFRLYPAGLLRLSIPHGPGRGFVFESEILIEAGRRGYSFLSVPIASVYPHGHRTSHFRPIMDILRIARMVGWKLISRGMYPHGLFRVLFPNPQSQGV